MVGNRILLRCNDTSRNCCPLACFTLTIRAVVAVLHMRYICLNKARAHRCAYDITLACCKVIDGATVILQSYLPAYYSGGSPAIGHVKNIRDKPLLNIMILRWALTPICMIHSHHESSNLRYSALIISRPTPRSRRH